MTNEKLPNTALGIRTRFILPLRTKDEVKSFLEENLSDEWEVDPIENNSIQIRNLFIKKHRSLLNRVQNILSKYTCARGKNFATFLSDKDQERINKLMDEALEVTPNDHPNKVEILLSPREEGLLADVTYFPILHLKISKGTVNEIKESDLEMIQKRSVMEIEKIFLGFLKGSRSS
jgi:hypothetical protein